MLHMVTWNSSAALVASWMVSQEVSLDPLTMGSVSPVSWDRLFMKAERMLNVTTCVQKQLKNHYSHYRQVDLIGGATTRG